LQEENFLQLRWSARRLRRLVSTLRLTPSLVSMSGFAVGDASQRVSTPVAFSKAHKNLTTLDIAEWLTSRQASPGGSLKC
jgi:hypothetical protein